MQVTNIIHLPALRGNPKRLYPKTSIENKYPGTFEHYTASIINDWQNRDSKKLKELIEALKTLKLSDKVESQEVDDTNAEIRVSLNSEKGPGNLPTVSIADVGFGVSQTLPVLVALIVAEKGQLVYIEQPEIHLHPEAQYNLAKIIVKAANRGVNVVIETHSDLLILGIQTLVAEGTAINAKKVILHWFNRGSDGMTDIQSSDLNIDGSYNHKTWPSDFGSVALRAQREYLDASEKHLFKS